MKKLMRRAGPIAALLGSLAWGFGAAGAARAQQALKPLAVKVGAYLPGDQDARGAARADATFVLEAEYTFETLLDRNYLSFSQVGIGYTERDELRILPVTVSQVFRDINATSGRGYYVSVGLGLYITRLDLPDTSGQTKGLLGGFVAGGLDFTNNLFAEAKYHVISRYDRKNVDGLQLAVGTRF